MQLRLNRSFLPPATVAVKKEFSVTHVNNDWRHCLPNQTLEYTSKKLSAMHII